MSLATWCIFILNCFLFVAELVRLKVSTARKKKEKVYFDSVLCLKGNVWIQHSVLQQASEDLFSKWEPFYLHFHDFFNMFVRLITMWCIIAKWWDKRNYPFHVTSGIWLWIRRRFVNWGKHRTHFCA